MPPFYIKISIKSFEISTLQVAKAKIEHLCSLVLLKREGRGSTLHRKGIPSCVAVTSFSTKTKACEPKRNESAWYTSLPSSRKKFTLLQSPHIDKKSREQFQWEVFRGQLGMFSQNRRVPALLLFLLKSSEFPGIQLKITIYYSTPL